MIVSDLESLSLRFIITAAIYAIEEKGHSEIYPYVEGILDWCRSPGTTEAAAIEIADLEAQGRPWKPSK